MVIAASTISMMLQYLFRLLMLSLLHSDQVLTRPSKLLPSQRLNQFVEPLGRLNVTKDKLNVGTPRENAVSYPRELDFDVDSDALPMVPAVKVVKRETETDKTEDPDSEFVMFNRESPPPVVWVLVNSETTTPHFSGQMLTNPIDQQTLTIKEFFDDPTNSGSKVFTEIAISFNVLTRLWPQIIGFTFALINIRLSRLFWTEWSHLYKRIRKEWTVEYSVKSSTLLNRVLTNYWK